MIGSKKIIVIAPCFNEEKKIGEVCHRLLNMNQKIVDEILIVDDGSTDTSPEVVESFAVRLIRLPKVIGVGAAIRRGFEFAIENQFDIIVVMAGNNKDEPNEIPNLVEPIVTDNFSFVQGSRYLKKSNLGSMPLYRKLATRLHPILFSLVTGKWVTESTNGFRAIDASLLKDERINLGQDWLNEYELEPYLYYKAVTLGYKTTEIPCTKIYPNKKTGYTKMKPITGWWSILRPLLLLRLGLRS